MFDLSHVPLFRGLPAAELAKLQSQCVTRAYPKNTVLMNEGDEANAMYICTEGRVKVFVGDEHGREFVLDSMGPGEYFGELSLLDDSQRSASIVTIEKSMFTILHKEDFKRIVLHQPELSLPLMQYLAGRIRKLTDNVKSLALQDVYGRVRNILMNLATEEQGETIVAEKLTQQEIANRVGSSREMVARILKELSTGGYISVEKKTIRILKKLPEAF